MDGASYHKNIINKNPTMDSNRAEMHAGYRRVCFSVKETKSDLMLRITPLKENPKYQAQMIASLHGHFLLYTPPYHPELQPVELIWSMVKGRIARDPPKNGNDAVEKVLDQLGEITRQNWIDVYRHPFKVTRICMYNEHEKTLKSSLCGLKISRLLKLILPCLIYHNLLQFIMM
ncbi:hypothetical protein JG687_00000568 [Phytophthora cactorum]|uniref:Tc1-like transposase DDE domain-containing protein n=1 Tax=Phytophthora cactorum TaxID=29920 RepID=A0A8T1V393_9STRA|nr:hypothetical protein JG687_00000568 [Phytophthora cactorum]